MMNMMINSNTRILLSIVVISICWNRFVDGWFLGMLGCQNRCQTYANYYQGRSPQAYGVPQSPNPYPPPPSNSYPTAPPSYSMPQSYPVAPQHSFPMNSYAQAQYAVAPSYPLPPMYPTPPAYVRPPVYATPPPVYATPPPPVYVTPPPPVYVTPPPPKCFQNNNGYKCCSRKMDKFLEEKVVEMMNPQWQRCNMQRLATQIQNEAQAMFNHSMESVVASGDMENLSRYRGDLYCKKKARDGKIVLIYGSAVPYSLDSQLTRPMTDEELQMANYPSEYNDINEHNGHENNINS